jgi:hypothetical protein
MNPAQQDVAIFFEPMLTMRDSRIQPDSANPDSGLTSHTAVGPTRETQRAVAVFASRSRDNVTVQL